MKNTLYFIALLLLEMTLVGCASDPLKAPCDVYGNFCGKKIKINQW